MNVLDFVMADTLYGSLITINGHNVDSRQQANSKNDIAEVPCC